MKRRLFLCHRDNRKGSEAVAPLFSTVPNPYLHIFLEQVPRKPYEEEIRELLFQNDPRWAELVARLLTCRKNNQEQC